MKKVLLALAACIGMSGTGYSQTVYSENFEGASIPSLPGTVTQSSPSGASGWVTNSGAVTWYQWTLPAHTKYAMVNDAPSAGLTNTADKLNTTSFSMGALTHPYLSFDFFFIKAYRSSGTGIFEASWVNVSGDGGSTWTTVDTLKGDAKNWQTHYIDLSAFVGKTNVIVQFFYYDGGDQLTGVAVDNIKVYQPDAWDASVTKATPAKGDLTGYYLLSTTANLGGTIFNYGYNTITSLTVNYKQSTGATVSTPLSVSIPPFTSYSFTSLSAPYSVPGTVSNNEVPVWVTLSGDVNATNDTAKAQVGAVSSMGTKQIVFEEATGTWCGFCPRGQVYMDSFARVNPNKATQIAVHNSDSMSFFSTNTRAYDTYIGNAMNTVTPIGTAQPGYPNMIIDRRELSDPSTIFSIYNSEKNYFAFADMSMTNPTITGSSLSTTVTVTPLTNLDGDIRIAVVITEFTLHGAPDSGSLNGWDQHNYYSSGAYGPLDGWEHKAAIVASKYQYYNFVARGSFPDVNGYPSSLPATMTAGTPYTYTVNLTLPARVKSNKIMTNILLIRQSDGVILNSISNGTQQVDVPTVSNPAAGIQGLFVFPNPAADQAFVKFDLDRSGSVDVIVTDMLGKLVYSNTQNMTAGTQQFSINTAAFAQGLYNIKIQTANGNITQRLSVVK